MSGFVNPDDDVIREILVNQKNFALVGASHKTVRPAYQVMSYLLDNGFNVYPVNPGQAGKEILGQKVFATLSDIDKPIDVIDIFRNSDAALPVVQAALPFKPQTIWMQIGVVNIDAARLAQKAGASVIMDKCPKIEYRRLIGQNHNL